MQKSIQTPEHWKLVELLKQLRVDAGLRQDELAARLGQSQSFVSNIERGQRRLDIIELRTYCAGLGVDLPKLVRRLEKLIS